MTHGPVRIHYHGHACVQVEWQGVRVLVDPYKSGDFGGAVDLPRVAGAAWTHVVSTHSHADHAYDGYSADAQTGERAERDLGVIRFGVAHDIHEGRLRGGSAGSLLLPTPVGAIVHLGDVGEPASTELLAQFPSKIRLLVVPCGGFFTIGANEAIEWVRALQPDVALVCHASDTGVRLPELTTTSEVMRRLGGADVRLDRATAVLELEAPGLIRPAVSRAPRWWFPRPSGHCAAVMKRAEYDQQHCMSAPGVSDTACCGI